MKKRLVFLLLTALASLLFPTSGMAQGNEPIILEISPSQIPADEKSVVTVAGENLTDPLSIYINSSTAEIALSYKLISSKEIAVTVPALASGSYTLCIRFSSLRDCRELRVTGLRVSVVSIQPAIIYNPVENQVSIVLKHGPEITNIYLNDVDLQISSITRDVNNDTDKVIVVVPPGNSVGTAKFTARLTDGQNVTIDSPITIKGPINASIDAVMPEKVLRYSTTANLLTIQGKNFEGIKSISWSPIAYCIDISSCDNVVITNTEIKISILDPGFVFDDAISDGKITFLDGSEVSLAGRVTVVDPVFPWHIVSWIALAAFLFLFSSSWAGIYDGSFSSEQNRSKSNQTAPGISHSFLIIVTGVGVSFLFGLVAWIIWGVVGRASLIFVASTLLITINLVYTVTFWSLSRKFGNFIPRITRIILVSVAVILTVGFPILFTYLMETEFTLIANGILFLGIASSGIWSVEYTRRRLEAQKIKGPTEAEIYNRVAEDIFRKGQLNAVKDYGELPKDRVVAAFSRFYSENKDNLKIEFSDYLGTLGFVKHENIKAINLAFQELRSKLSTANDWSSSDVNKLVQILRKEFGFKPGKSLQKVKKSYYFFTYALRPTGVESVLPDPFPIIVYASNQVIIPAELEELQEILNQLDTKARFALLIVVNQALAVKDKIQERFKGIGRENIVVLGEKECKEIIGNADTLRLAFMKVLQGQVDLLVFKPYQVEGATPVDMFYGRKQEINSVLERITDGSAAVLGARRIGKTSMLQATKRILEDRGKLVLYLDCYDVFDYSTLLKRMELDWEIHDVPKNILKTLNDFPNWLAKIQGLYPKKQIVLLLDEIDQLISYDLRQRQQEKLFRMFRSLAQEGRCQFIFSGERLILEQLSNSKSPFFNFVSPIRLGLLDNSTTNKIVTDPMGLIGTTIENEKEILRLIFEYSNGHPSLVQYICLKSLEDMNRRKTRIFDPATVLTVIEGQMYHDRYLETYWSQSTPLEKAVSIIVAESQPVSVNQIHSKLKDNGFKVSIEELRKGIRYLGLCQLLVSNKEEYGINLVKFKEMYSMFTYSTWMEDLCQEWKQMSKEKL